MNPAGVAVMQVASELVDGNTGRPPTVRNEPDSETVAKPPALATVRAPGSGHVVLGCPNPLFLGRLGCGSDPRAIAAGEPSERRRPMC